MADLVHNKRVALLRRISLEEHWYPNKDEADEYEWWNPGDYFSSGLWDTDQLTSAPPMCFTITVNPWRKSRPRSSLQICSIKIASIKGGLRWPLEVFGMVTVRDVLDRRRNIVYARARSNCQTITEKDPYLTLTGPTRAIVTCMDAGSIEVVLKAKGATESEDRDLSSLIVLLKNSMYCSYDKDYTSKRSTLLLNFRHIMHAAQATISVRHVGGSSLPSGAFQGAFTASTASIEDAEVLLLAFKDGKLPIADDGTINLSRRVVSVKYSDKERLKVSIVAECTKDEQDATRDDVEFVPDCASTSYGELNVGAWKMQVTVAWSLFGDSSY
ncbi:unnamed protein product [Alopecurus aequalis]